MREEDIIFFEPKKKQWEDSLLSSFEYAILSIPFTVNRMNLTYIWERVVNIVKGKLGENLFKEFLKSNNLISYFDFDSTQTPFFIEDKRDFLFNGYEWDIKNNFVRCKNYTKQDILQFLALVPNRHRSDQWEMRNRRIFIEKAPNGVAFLFTFMEIIDIKLNLNHEKMSKVETLIKEYSKRCNKINEEYKNMDKKREEALRKIGIEYENRLKSLEANFKSFFGKIENVSTLIITGYATEKEFIKFRDCYRGYSFTARSSKEDCFRLRIRNKCIEVGELPSFMSLIKEI